MHMLTKTIVLFLNKHLALIKRWLCPVANACAKIFQPLLPANTSSNKSPLLQFYLFLAIALAYYFTGKLGLMVPYKESVATLLWLPTGIATGALMRWGKISIPAIFVAAYFVERAMHLPPQTAAIIALGNTLAPMLTAYCLQNVRFSGTKFNTALVQQSDIAFLFIFSAVGMLLSATIGTFTLYASNTISANQISSVWLIWWVGDSIGVLLALPLVLNTNRTKLQQLKQLLFSRKGYPLFAWLSAFIFVELVISAMLPSLNKQLILSIFFILPVLIWTSYHFGIIGGSIVVITLSTVVVWITANGFGAFYSINADEGIFSLWVYVVSLVLTMLLISALQSERKLVEVALRKSEQKFRAVIEGALDGIITIDAKGKIVEFNPAAEQIFGYKKAAVLGKPLGDIIIPPSHRQMHEDKHSAYVATGKKHVFDQRLEFNAMRADGTEFPVELTIIALKDGSDSMVTGFVRDISLQKSTQLEIEKIAYYDILTGLPNRRLLIDRFHHAAVTTARLQNNGAMLFIDLDNFKLLNDTKGHEVGDALLRAVATRICSTLREGDTIARLSGDEFVVILENLDGTLSVAESQASDVAEKLLQALSQYYTLGQFEFSTSCSIGITLFNNHIIAFEEHLRNADIAMYQAKANGRNTYCFYDISTQRAVDRRFAIEAELHTAIKNEELTLHFQSIVNVNQQVIGAEALLRWNSASLGEVGPAEFIPIAEKTNQILMIGNWVLRSACLQIQAWSSRPHLQDLRISVNISAKQFLDTHFISYLQSCITEFGINPDSLKLELTETAVIDNIEDVIRKFKIISAMGVRISLDDFGMGYSSLGYIKKLPISQIKIDLSFVHDMLTDSNDAAIIQMILAIGKTIHCNIVAEGVENIAQFEALKDFGCEYFQGYYFCKPVNADTFERQLNR